MGTVKAREGTSKPGQGRTESFAASYMRAFPGADVASLQAHLDLAGVSAALASELELRIEAVGFDLSRPRYTIVRMLYLAIEEGLPQSYLAQELEVSGPYMTQLIDTLADDGWVERIVKRPDRRVTYVQLTDEGRRRCGILVPAIVQYMVDSVCCLTPEERAQLTYLTNKVRSNLAKARDQ